uniref:Lin-66-like winged helix domain-containing protein n=1 Tax=Plectus sambesii TaxID=2011161 RepID=A0A914WNY0_9BILA
MAAPSGNSATNSVFFPSSSSMSNFWNSTPFMSQQSQPPGMQSPMTPITSPLPFPPQSQQSSAAANMFYQQAALNVLNNPQLAAAMMAQLQSMAPPQQQPQQQLHQSLSQSSLHSAPPTPSSHMPMISPPLSSNSNRSAAHSPTFPSNCTTPSPPAGAMPNDMRGGIGVLTWLSSKAGLIRCSGDMGTVSFQLKDFCDQAVSDLTAVLRPGFTLKFQALSSGQRDWIATFVAPVHGQSANLQFTSDEEVDLEAPLGSETGPPQMPRDPYSMELELRAVPMLLQIFERQGLPQCQLSSFHCQISNCGDDDLYRYVGTSSLKRRQFLERRTHLFHISASDLVSLQPAEIYATVLVLAKRLLCRGGACLMQELFDHFNSCPDIPLEARELIGDGKTNFLRFLESHPWIFAVFPSRVFVSIRRNLPTYDYAAFLNEHFSDCDLRQYSPLNASRTTSSSASRAFPPMPKQLPPVAPVSSRGPPSAGLVDSSGWPPLPSQDLPKDPAPSNKYSPTGTFDAYNNSGGGGGQQSMSNGYGHNHQQQRSRQPSTPGWGAPTPIEELQQQQYQPQQRPISVQSQPVTTGFWGRGPTSTMMDNSAASNGHAADAQPMGRVGGRMKRFCDVDAQTDPVNWPPHKPAMVETGCGPDDDTVAVKEPSAKGFVPAMSASSGSSSSSPNLLWQQQMETTTTLRSSQQGKQACAG